MNFRPISTPKLIIVVKIAQPSMMQKRSLFNYIKQEKEVQGFQWLLTYTMVRFIAPQLCLHELLLLMYNRQIKQ